MMPVATTEFREADYIKTTKDALAYLYTMVIEDAENHNAEENARVFNLVASSEGGAALVAKLIGLPAHSITIHETNNEGSFEQALIRENIGLAADNEKLAQANIILKCLGIFWFSSALAFFAGLLS